MKRFVPVFFASCFALSSVQAGQYVLGENFVVSHPTIISALGANDGGTSFTSTETVGIFSEQTGDLVGPEVVFGPGSVGTQLGNLFYESVPTFTLSPGDYSIISIITTTPSTFNSTGSSTGGFSGGLSGGNSQGLDGDLNLPGGTRFNSGTGLNISPSEGSGTGNNTPLACVDPVPDGGMTAMLLGASLAGLGWVRRKI